MSKPDFNKMNGLIPAIVQDVETKQVLMLAYVNEEAYERMLETKQTCFWSRSRQELWHKGETSGHFQYIEGMYLDCDNDTLLIYVHQKGAACHTGSYSCFFNEVFPYDGADALDRLFDNQVTEKDLDKDVQLLNQAQSHDEALNALADVSADLSARMQEMGITPLELEQKIKKDHPLKGQKKRIFYRKD